MIVRRDVAAGAVSFFSQLIIDMPMPRASQSNTCKILHDWSFQSRRKTWYTNIEESSVTNKRSSKLIGLLYRHAFGGYQLVIVPIRVLFHLLIRVKSVLVEWLIEAGTTTSSRSVAIATPICPKCPCVVQRLAQQCIGKKNPQSALLLARRRISRFDTHSYCTKDSMLRIW